MDVRWITAFVDRPAAGFDATVAFWATAAGATRSAWRGEHDEFATLVPVDGSDAHLRVQRTDDGRAGSHIDLHVADVRQGVAACTGAGASLRDENGTYAVLTSPGGMAFCVVPHRGEQTRQGPVVLGPRGTATLVDQVCIDVDPDALDTEARFWTTITGWAPVASSAPEFVPLDRPPAMPLRLMLQARDRPSGPTTCHLDLACEDVPAAVADHEALGAVAGSVHRHWTVMADPSGVEYCCTGRRPDGGRLPPADSSG